MPVAVARLQREPLHGLRNDGGLEFGNLIREQIKKTPDGTGVLVSVGKA